MSYPIAIVGMACRYPDADTIEQLFVNSLAQRRAFRRIPEVRLGSGYFDHGGNSSDRAYVQQAAVIRGFEFDRERFRVSRASYEGTDLTHWLALTVAHEAIKDIRFRKGVSHVAGDAVRVVVGNSLTGEFSRASTMRLRWPYVRAVVSQHLKETLPDIDGAARERHLRDLEGRYKAPFAPPNEDFLAGGLANTIAGRICNHFNFRGGGFTVDGACSSSLLAVADACSALVAGDADMALAGGVDLSLDPFELVGFSRTGALAREEMLVYDEHSQGFWPGEGCGFVALMRYDDALSQTEHIYGVIRGWGISSDGHGGLTRPESEGHMLALRRCYQRAGYSIASVGYFEGHGTGTKIGDTAELRALIEARRNCGEPIYPAVISSIKANIGHTKAAAGMAGLLRAVKCVAEHVLPPTTACRRPHSLFAGNADNLAPADRSRAWEADKMARRAGISAMGFGGINTHVTIEEAPPSSRTSGSISVGSDFLSLDGAQDSELFLFAASRPEDLVWTIDHVAAFADQCSCSELTDLAVELAHRATRGSLSPWKAAVVAKTPLELCQKLKRLMAAPPLSGHGDVHLDLADGTFLSRGNAVGQIGLIFSGQAAPVRDHGGALARRFGAVREIYQKAGLDSFSTRNDTDFAQPAIVTASLAGIEVLRRFGICGNVALGHSLGELTALHWAGCLDACDLLAIVKTRGKAMTDSAETAGAMVAIAASRDAAAAAISQQQDLFVSNVNSHRQTVVGGSREAVERLIPKLRQSGVPATLLSLRRAFHTPAMRGVARDLRRWLEGFEFYPAERRVISTVTGHPLPVDIDIAAHICDQIVSPVDFLAAVNLAAREAQLFVEVGPGDLLEKLARSICETPVISIDVGGESLRPLLLAVAAAYVLGRSPAVANLFTDRYARRFDWDWRPNFFQNPCERIAPEPDLEPVTESEEVAESAQQRSAIPESDASTLHRLRQTIAARTGLPAWTLQDSSRMLSDLHLNSITVGEIVTQMSASLGLPPLVDPTEYANASIDQIAAALDHLRESGAAVRADQPGAPSGLASWVRFFEVTRDPASPSDRQPDRQRGNWEGFGAIGPNENLLLKRLNAEAHDNGVIVWLGAHPGTHELRSWLQASQRCIELASQSASPFSFVVVQHGWGASGFVKSLFLENEHLRTLVINLPSTHSTDTADWIVQEIDSDSSGFKEVFFDATGQREEPRLRLLKISEGPESSVLDAEDVVLVSGGGKGISAECAIQLARRTGCALLIVGRSSPGDSVELANNLDRLRKAGLRVSYQTADVTEATEVAQAVARGTAELNSPVTGIIHGAGLNMPCTVAKLSISRIEATVAPKIKGLQNLLAAVEPTQLKLLAPFSSIIARIGLPGEADYALANEWLSHETEEFQLKHPGCRCRAIEWSVWSGTGMGQRLARIDVLSQQGISAISIDDGVREFLRLLNSPSLPARVVVSGRFGNPRTIAYERAPVIPLRFVESIPVYYRDTELVAEFNLSPQSDPYLDDHVLNGERLFPAVLAMEAMTQVAVAMTLNEAGSVRPRFRDVKFGKAIVVPPGTAEEGITLRVIALADPAGDISLAIRSSTTDFQVNHVEARCILQKGADAAENSSESETLPASETLPVDLDHSLYRNALFQKGRFKRVQGYYTIEARRCSGQLSMDGETEWFSQNLPKNCLLGDPGARDAALHAVQACIPHKIVIPIAVEAVDCGVLDPAQTYRFVAEEVEDRGQELVYDLTIIDRDGRPQERWRKLTLRILGEVPNLRLNSLPLVTPLFERKIATAMPLAQLKVAVEQLLEKQGRGTAAITPDRRPDGKPDSLIDFRFRSFAYNDYWKLSVESKFPVGCDLQHVQRRRAGEWAVLLGSEGFKLAGVVAELSQEHLDVSGTRVWTAREAMKKAGVASGAPLTFDADCLSHWIVFKSGGTHVFSSWIESPTTGVELCIAIALSNVQPERPHFQETG